jgi:hypothetical protein
MDIVQMVLAIAAGSTLVFGTIAVWVLMGFYSIRIFRGFRGGVLSAGWKYICIAIPFLIFGQLFTGLGTSSSVTVTEEIFRSLGASTSLLGGIMIVVGFRTQYNAWHPKGMEKAASTRSEALAPTTEA